MKRYASVRSRSGAVAALVAQSGQSAQTLEGGDSDRGIAQLRRQYRHCWRASARPDDAGRVDRPRRRRLPRHRRGACSTIASKVKFTPLTAKERLTALQSGEIDLLSRNTTWTMSRDTSLGLTFAGTSYYDGQGFMVKKSLGVTSALQLGGASVCVQTGTTAELNMADFFKRNNMQYNPVVFEQLPEEMNAAYNSGRCDAYRHRRLGPLRHPPDAYHAR